MHNALFILYKKNLGPKPPKQISGLMWTCETCTCENQASLKSCAVCGCARNTPSMPFVVNSDSWECEVCACLNSKNVRRCDVCGSSSVSVTTSVACNDVKANGHRPRNLDKLPQNSYSQELSGKTCDVNSGPLSKGQKTVNGRQNLRGKGHTAQSQTRVGAFASFYAAAK